MKDFAHGAISFGSGLILHEPGTEKPRLKGRGLGILENEKEEMWNYCSLRLVLGALGIGPVDVEELAARFV